MARVAELSMMKCKLLDSEHERTKLQEQLEDAYVRLEKGLAPTIEAQAEWKRYLDKQVDKEIQQQRVTELTEGKGPLNFYAKISYSRRMIDSPDLILIFRSIKIRSELFLLSGYK